MTTALAAPRPTTRRRGAAPLVRSDIPWVVRAHAAPYFLLDSGEPWTPVGANEAITWPELAGLFRRRDLHGVEAHLRRLRECGVTVLRLMLEYGQGEHRYLERPAGRFVPAMVRLWDDLFALCERVGMRVLLTPFDTFFLWRRWRHHPYNRRRGGMCATRTELLQCRDTREAVKARLAFATERWGASGALFAWDLWNELHPAQGGGEYSVLWDFVTDVSSALRELELRVHGRAHPQTVSFFGPDQLVRPEYHELVFRHPGLDFASTHFYARNTIDDPRNTVAPAVAAGMLVQQALAEIRDERPFLDSEHGPIHRFKNRHRALPAEFDDEYFRHMQWAHLATGGAGGGMRWPYRHPHTLTSGMRDAQHALARFIPLIDWTRFRRREIGRELTLRDAGSGAPLRLVAPHSTTPQGKPPWVRLRGRTAAAFGCADDGQAVLYLLRSDSLTSDGRLARDAAPLHVTLDVPGLSAGEYVMTEWHTLRGEARTMHQCLHEGGMFRTPTLVLATDLALALRRVSR